MIDITFGACGEMAMIKPSLMMIKKEPVECVVAAISGGVLLFCLIKVFMSWLYGSFCQSKDVCSKVSVMRAVT